MKDVYGRLARALDKLPQGFPATESGLELRILRKIFSPEDAEAALRLKPIPETAGAIARRWRRPEDEVRATLEGMASRGQILSFKQRGRQRYAMAPWVVGIYEFQLERMDRELAELCEAYMPVFGKTVGGTEPGLARVVPVNKTIDAEATVLAYEDVRRMLDEGRSFRLMDCICRQEQAALGNPCSHTLETCLAFSREPDAYDSFPPWGRTITKDEALAVLDAAEEEGLVHCTYNLQRDQMFICNCCSCCCGFLKLLTELETPYGLIRSNWVATIDPELCSGCGVCVDERCPVGAIEVRGESYEVTSDRCIGCGVCAVTCPTDAIELAPRPESERTEPPPNIVDWSVRRAANRSGPVKGLVLRGWLAWESKRSRDHRG